MRDHAGGVVPRKKKIVRLFPSLFIPDRYVHSDYAGGEGRAVVGLEVTGGSFHVVEAQIEQGRLQRAMRMLAKSDRFQREARSIPAMSVTTPKEMTTRHRTRITLINAFFLGDAVGADLGEGHEAHQAGEGEEAEHRVTSRVTALLKAVPGASSAKEAREPRELVHLEPGVGAVGEPHPAHNHHEPGEGADDDGVQEHAQGLTQPWSQGCLASEAAAGMVMVPCPASLDMRPRLTPWARATPKAPPNMASGWKAWVKTAEKNQGYGQS